LQVVDSFYGTKMGYLQKYLKERLLNKTSRIIIFSQWKTMLELVSQVLDNSNIKYTYLKGNIYVVSKALNTFKNDESIRILLLSAENCTSGSNLTEATDIVLLDTINGDKDTVNAIENQAIGRAARMGQKNRVNVVRFIMKDTVEEEFYKKNIDRTNIDERTS